MTTLGFLSWRLDMLSLRKPLWSVAVLVLLAVAPAAAQSTVTTLTGVVRDTQKAPIAGATVTATNTATKAVLTAITGADGRYSLSLPPGSWSVTATSSGYWGPAVGVEAVAGRDSEADFSLSMRPTEVVTVTATKR